MRIIADNSLRIQLLFKEVTRFRAVKSNSYVDIKTMAALVKITSWVFPDFKFDWIVDESKKNIPQELDFTLEGRNAEKVKALFKDFHWLKVRSRHSQSEIFSVCPKTPKRFIFPFFFLSDSKHILGIFVA